MNKLADSIKDFALSDERLFPCDSPALINASAKALDDQSSKLPPMKKLAAARHIAKRSVEQGVVLGDHDFLRVVGTHLSPSFLGAMDLRKEATAHHPKAVSTIETLTKTAQIIDLQKDDKIRQMLLDVSVKKIAEFDREWSGGDLKLWYDNNGVPDPADTVFKVATQSLGVLDSIVDDNPVPPGRHITAAGLAAFDKVAAAKVLTPAVMKIAESFEAFEAADAETKCLIATFIS